MLVVTLFCRKNKHICQQCLRRFTTLKGSRRADRLEVGSATCGAVEPVLISCVEIIASHICEPHKYTTPKLPITYTIPLR